MSLRVIHGTNSTVLWTKWLRQHINDYGRNVTENASRDCLLYPIPFCSILPASNSRTGTTEPLSSKEPVAWSVLTPLSHQILIIIYTSYILCKALRTWVCTNFSKDTQNLEFHKDEKKIFIVVNIRSLNKWKKLRGMNNSVSHGWEEDYVQQCKPCVRRDARDRCRWVSKRRKFLWHGLNNATPLSCRGPRSSC